MLLAAAPDEAYRALLLSRGPLPADAKPTVREVKQPFFPGMKFFRGTGSANMGHRELEPATLVQQADVLTVVIAETENIDPEGYHQRLRELWLCPIEHERLVRSTVDIAKLSALAAARASKCTSFTAIAEARFTKALGEKQPDAYAAFLAALVLGYETVTPLEKQSQLEGPFKKLFSADGGHDVAWVKGPVGFAPWVKLTEGGRFAGLGMAVGGTPPTLELLEVRFEPRYTRERGLDGGVAAPSSENRLSVSHKTVAFSRRFIE